MGRRRDPGAHRAGRSGRIALLGLVVFVLVSASLVVPENIPGAVLGPSEGSTLSAAPSPAPSSSLGSSGSFSVETTTVLANQTTLPGNFLASNGIAPDATAYDPNSSTLWVANGGSGTVSVINLTLGGVVAVVPVGSDPTALLYDSGVDRVFVVNEFSYNVSVIDASSFRVVGSIPVSLAPLALALDPAHQTLYVVNSNYSAQSGPGTLPGNGSLTWVNASTLAVGGNLSVGKIPTDALYGPGGDLYAVALGSCRLSTIDPANDSVLANVSLPAGTCGAGRPVGCPYSVNPLPGSATLAYDASNGLLYVGVTNIRTPCNYTNSVEAYDLANDSWVYGRTVPLGDAGFGNSTLAQIAYDPEIPAILAEFSGNGSVGRVAALDPAGLATIGIRSINGTVFGLHYSAGLRQVLWANSLTGRVTRANSTTLDPVTRYAVGTNPVALVAAPELGVVAVAEYAQNSVVLLNATQGRVVGEWPVGREPSAVAYDPQTEELAVANSGSGNLTILNLSLGQAVATVPIGGEPSGVAYDRANGSWWVSGGNSGTVTEISVATSRVQRIVPVDPSAVLSGLAIDSRTDSVYVGLLTNSTVAVVNASSGAVEALIPVGLAPSSLAYVPADGAVFVANAGSGNLSVVNDTALNVTNSIPVPNLPLSVGYDPAQGVILAAQYGTGSLAVVSVAFQSVQGFLEVGAGPSGVASDPATGEVFIANANSGTVSTVGVRGFPVEVNESGLPANSTWWLNLTGGAHVSASVSSLSLSLINGTYAYSASTSTPGYAASPGFFIVHGGPVQVQVTFAPATSPVTFDAVGLPAGTPWFVNLSGGESGSTRGTALTFNLTNGSYTYAVETPDRSYAPSPASGRLLVQGSLLGVEVRFSLVTSPVIFQETGLPHGTVWYVATAGDRFTDNRSSMAAGLPNGTYRYTAGTANSSYRAAGGGFTVDGSPVEVNISFSLVVFSVVIAQSGLPNGTAWSVVIQGQTLVSRNGTAQIELPNGSYAFRLDAPPGYTAVPGNGTISVAGSPVLRAVSFSANGASSSTRLYLIGGVAVAAFAAGTIIFLIGRRRHPRPPVEPK